MRAVNVAAAFISSFSVSVLRVRPCMALRTVRPVALLKGDGGRVAEEPPPPPLLPDKLAEEDDDMAALEPGRALLLGVAGGAGVGVVE